MYQWNSNTYVTWWNALYGMVEIHHKRRKAGLKIDVTGENEKEMKWKYRERGAGVNWALERPIKMVCLPGIIARQHSHMHRHIPRRNGGDHGLSLWQTEALFNCCYHTPGHHGTTLAITNAVKKHGTKLSYLTENVRKLTFEGRPQCIWFSIHVMHTDLKTSIPNFCISWFQRAWHKTLFCNLYDTISNYKSSDSWCECKFVVKANKIIEHHEHEIASEFWGGFCINAFHNWNSPNKFCVKVTSEQSKNKL